MLKGILFSLLVISHTAFARPASMQELLRLDAAVRSDSINSWYKYHIRQLDSAAVITILDKLEQLALAEHNKIVVATVPYVKAQYYELRLKRGEESETLYQEAISRA